MLFGCQAIGGSENHDPRHEKFFKHSVSQLFVDSDGIYCSSARCDPCIVTGVFYEEPQLENEESEREIERVF